ncbi:hypothetical protein ACROYT_G010012 [Oculina patagonica]
MNSGQEGVIAVREERVVEAGVEVTSNTLIAATDEGDVVAMQINTAEASANYQPVAEAWPVHSTTVAPIGPPPPTFTIITDVRKKSWSNRLEDFCCSYDINSKWYKLEGKGIWCVLFLLLGYLIVAVLVLAVGILYCVFKIIAACQESSPEPERRPQPSNTSSVSSCSCCCC